MLTKETIVSWISGWATFSALIAMTIVLILVLIRMRHAEHDRFARNFWIVCLVATLLFAFYHGKDLYGDTIGALPDNGPIYLEVSTSPDNSAI
ncbi:hypothetical protein IK146_00380 [Candidatus Saccharibacteria bacterium]|nr:hypothetical protein [Candidatus Saccharibacteria bacterium]